MFLGDDRLEFCLFLGVVASLCVGRFEPLKGFVGMTALFFVFFRD